MKHFFFYDSNGLIRGHGQSLPGWGPDCDPNDPNTPCELGRALHQSQIVKYGYAGAVSWDCPCPYVPVGTDTNCTCYSEITDYYVENGALTLKPIVKVYIDNILVPNVSTINKTPGSWLNFRLEADVPNGHQLFFHTAGAALSVEEQLSVTFDDGVSTSILLKAPAQGLVGHIGNYDQYVRPVYLTVRGWA